MVKPLPLRDFRAVRMVLEPSDFALSNGRETPASDLIDEETWHGLTQLPDDVSIRTSNYHGGSLKLLHDLWVVWIESVGEDQDPLFGAILDASDEFQAATFNALTGYYRQSIGCLRNALEQTVIGAYFQLCRQLTDYKDWQSGKLKCSFGTACSFLRNVEEITALETFLRSTLDDSLFDQKQKAKKGGWARRVYSELSEYSHSRPGFSAGDLWESNGPVYVQKAFLSAVNLAVEVSAICFMLVKIARPNFPLAPIMSNINQSKALRPLGLTVAAFNFLWGTRLGK